MNFVRAEFVFFEWVPEDGTRVTVLPLCAGGTNKVFQLPALFVLHFANAFEKDIEGLGPCICIDAPHYSDPSIINANWLDVMRDRTNEIPTATWKCAPDFSPLQNYIKSLTDTLILSL